MGSSSRWLLNQVPIPARPAPQLPSSSRGATGDQLGPVEPVDRFSQSVFVAVTLAANGRFDASFRQAFGVSNADVLRASVGVMNQAAAPLGLPVRMPRSRLPVVSA